MLKILCVNIPPCKEGTEEAEFTKNVYSPAVFERIKNYMGDVEVVFRTCEWGIPALGETAPLYRHFDVLAHRNAFYAATKADEEGFDGVFLDCAGDPYLQELRQHLSIPVVGLFESSVLLSNVMGKSYGAIGVNVPNIPGMEIELKGYSGYERCVGIEVLPPGGEDLLPLGLSDSKKLLDGMKIASEKLAAKGAEVILPGCSFMSLAALAAPGAEDAYPNGLKEVDGAILPDIIGNAVCLLRTLIELQKSDVPWISRKLRYMMPTPHEKELFKPVAEDPNLKYWDHTMKS